jgi:BlaI family transcriptional regulator, penicillinase repressor
MARRRSATLTDGELRLMHVLWRKGEATVADVLESLPPRPPVAYNTVQTVLRILEGKGYLRHEKRGRAFVYRPLIDQRTARRSALSHLLDRMFNSSPSLLVLNVLDDDRIDAAELRQLRQLIDQASQGL